MTETSPEPDGNDLEIVDMLGVQTTDLDSIRGSIDDIGVRFSEFDIIEKGDSSQGASGHE